jgi:glutamate---cysteine ligase / carboxylate-amine ligase
MEFSPSELGTVGVELELQIVDPMSLDARDGILPIMERVGSAPYIRPEFVQDCVEIGTRVCRSAAEIEEHLRQVASHLHREAESLGLALCSTGTHPFCRHLGTMTPVPRFLELEAQAAFVARTQQVFATHVHVGMVSGSQAIAVMQELRSYLPMLLALSANSPFWRGYNTDCASYRTRLLATTRDYGLPPNLESWEQFCELCDVAQRAGFFKSIKDIHWDLRPQPSLGTLEIRIMDAQSRVGRVAELAALVRALVVYLTRDERAPGLPGPLPTWIEKQNHYQASVLGLDAPYVFDVSGATCRLGDLCQHVAACVYDVAAELGDAAYLDALPSGLLQRPGYVVQREALARRRSFRGVVEELIADFGSSLAHGPRKPVWAEMH